MPDVDAIARVRHPVPAVDKVVDARLEAVLQSSGIGTSLGSSLSLATATHMWLGTDTKGVCCTWWWASYYNCKTARAAPVQLAASHHHIALAVVCTVDAEG